MKINKIPFSLEKYESDNYRIVTRDGRDARVICKDRTDKNYPIVALIKDNGNEFIHVYSKNGESIIDEESIYDLFLVNQVFKKGDIIHFQNEDDETAIFNFREGKYVYIYFYYNDRNGTICYNDIIADNFRIATEEEKQKMFDALAKEGKRWNAENKCIEDIKKVEVNGINLIHAYVKTNEGTGICVLGFHKNILISEAACLGHIKKEYVKNNN